MKTIKLRNPMYFELKKEDQETPHGVSLTVPDQSTSLAELLRRHTAGIAPEVSRTPIYDELATHDSADYTKINSLDLSEKDEIRKALKSNITNLSESVKPKPEKTPAKTDQPEPKEEPATTPAKKGKPKPVDPGED
jgi:hypothetical protein